MSRRGTMLVRAILTIIVFSAAEDRVVVVPQRPCAASVPVATMPGAPVPPHVAVVVDRAWRRSRHRHTRSVELHRGPLGAVAAAPNGAG